MPTRESSLERLARLDQLIIMREMNLTGLLDILEKCRRAGVKRPPLVGRIGRAEAALRRLEEQRARVIEAC
jgi:hypothetical protein